MTDQQRKDAINSLKSLISLVSGLRKLAQQQQEYIDLQAQSSTVLQESLASFKAGVEEWKATIANLQAQLVEAMSRGESTSEELEAQMNQNALLNAAVIERDMALKAKDRQIAELGDKLNSPVSVLSETDPELDKLIELAGTLAQELTAPTTVETEAEQPLPDVVEPAIEVPVNEPVVEAPTVEPFAAAGIEQPLISSAEAIATE